MSKVLELVNPTTTKPDTVAYKVQMHVPSGIHKLFEKIATQRGSSVAAVYLHATEDWMNSHGYDEILKYREVSDV
jgi:hypothetical protein